MWSSHTMGYYIALKKENSPHATMDEHQNIMMSIISWSEKDVSTAHDSGYEGPRAVIFTDRKRVGGTRDWEEGEEGAVFTSTQDFSWGRYEHFRDG